MRWEELIREMHSVFVHQPCMLITAFLRIFTPTKTTRSELHSLWVFFCFFFRVESPRPGVVTEIISSETERKYRDY